MDGRFPTQMGLFGRCAVTAGTHVVHAHLRLLPDGGTTFVSEHVRWNRGRKALPPAAGPRPRQGREEDPAQLPLWSR